MGRLSVLECAFFWEFPLLFALLHLFPSLRLFVTVKCRRPKRQEARDAEETKMEKMEVN